MKRLLRKANILILLSIAFSLLAPMTSYAAMTLPADIVARYDVMSFTYYPADTCTACRPAELSGYVYAKDPTSVSVRANINGAVTPVPNQRAIGNYLYDDNNVPYSVVEYEYGAIDHAPSSLIVDLEGKTYELTGIPDENQFLNPGVYHYTSDLSSDIGTYRMPGELQIDTQTAATYLPAGSDIVSFSPTYIEGAYGEGIILRLPYNDSRSTTFNADSLTLSDFEIIDQTPSVSSSVYLYGFTHTSSGALTFNLKDRLVQGHQYRVRLSSTSSGNEIMLPTDGIYRSSVKLGMWGNGYLPTRGEPEDWLEEANSLYFRNIDVGNPDAAPPSEPPAEPSDGTPNDPPSDPAEAPSDRPSDPVDVPYFPPAPPVVPAPLNPPSNNQVIVNEESLKNGTEDKVSIDIADEKRQVLLPAKAADFVGDRNLELKSEKITVEIPPEVLKKLQNLVSSEKLDEAQISFSIDSVNASDTTKLLNMAEEKAKARLKAVGEVYDFKLSLITADGKAMEMTQLDEAITLRLMVSDNANQTLLGMYYITGDGSLEYVGGQLFNGDIVAKVSHFSKYAVLEYDKSFDDVPAKFWASDVIKELTAKHIISGENHHIFAPHKKMNRGEFAELIVRTLGLKASKPVTFSDVQRDNIHTDAIAAAYEAGIIRGRSANTFAPGDRITREEMAAMITKAYEYKNGHKPNPSVRSDYVDRATANDWALPYIDAATNMGLVQGRSKGKFAPKQFITRAEGAQVIYQLLKSL